MRRNAISDAVVSQLDLLPTILELAKHPQAKALAESLDGKSLVSLLSDTGADWPDRELFWHYPGYRISNPKTMTGQRPEVVNVLRLRLHQWRMNTGAPMPERKDAVAGQSSESRSLSHDKR